MTIDQKAGSVGVSSAMRKIANGFLLVLGLILYLLGPDRDFVRYSVNRCCVRAIKCQKGSGKSVLDFGPRHGGSDGVAKGTTSTAGAA
jgi:hypothetical protein